MSAEDFKNKGNEALQKGDYGKAIEFYSEGLKLEPKNHLLLSNRSAAYAKIKKYQEALDDSEIVCSLQPNWSKSYLRKGIALHGLNRLDEAIETYEKGLKIEPNNQQLKDLLIQAQNQGERNLDENIKNMFGDVVKKIENHPKYSQYLKDEEFKNKLKEIQKNPQKMQEYLATDKRIMEVLGFLIGIDTSQFDQGDQEQTSQTQSPQQQQQKKDDIKLEEEPIFEEEKEEEKLKEKPKEEEKEKEKPKKEEEKKKEEKEEDKMEIEEEEEELEDEKNKKLAEKEKEIGNNFYKKKQFDDAIIHYDKAISLDPKNMVFKLNKAAVLIEKGEYENSIKECKDAIQIGRKNYADFKLIAKAYSRMGNAYLKLEKYDESINAYKESLTEHRTAETLSQVNKVEKIKKQKEEESYLNPELSQKEKELGNNYFKENKIPDAINHYKEAIKRNPKDFTLYSNLGTCYFKLGEPVIAIKHFNQCLELDPKFIKAHIRKGNCHFLMKEFHKAIDCYKEALAIDPQNKEALEAYKKVILEIQTEPQSKEEAEERIRRAQSDPEIQKILLDPMVQTFLKRMQEDPKSAMSELEQNPDLEKKVERLFQSGLMRFGH